jgi:hypothetical protein
VEIVISLLVVMVALSCLILLVVSELKDRRVMVALRKEEILRKQVELRWR